MTATINASTSGGGGIIQTADSSGILALQTAGVTAVTINGSQNVGIGTTTPSNAKLNSIGADTAPQLNLYGSSSGALGANFTYKSASGDLYIATNGFNSSSAPQMVLSASGNVGIGTSSPTAKVQVFSNGAPASSGNMTTGMAVASAAGSFAINIGADATAGYTWLNSAYINSSNTASPMVFMTGATERARIDSSGNLLVGTTSGGARLSVSQSVSDWAANIVNTNASQYYVIRANSTTTKNDTSSLIYDGLDNGTLRFRVYSNGGIANYSANNSNLSDIREKKDIELAGNYLDKICAIPVKTFLYNEQTDADKNLGVIAQDVQAVAPELVAETDWGTEEEPKMRLSIYQTDLQYALMKCIQEQQALITTLTERITALEAK